jgi:hypothetical protein
MSDERYGSMCSMDGSLLERSGTMLKRMMLAVLVVGLMASVAAAGVVEVTIEDFDNVTAGVYGTGLDFGEVATLSGWEIGGRYITITDRDSLGDMDATGNAAYGSTCVATAVSVINKHGSPVYEAADALDMSASTHVKIALTNNSAVTNNYGSNGAISMYYRDATDSLDKAVNITASGWGNRAAGDSWTHTTLLSGLTGFDKTEDLVYGFRMYPNSVYDNPNYLYPTWDSIVYGVEIPPVAEPASLSLLGLGLLALRKKRS